MNNNLLSQAINTLKLAQSEIEWNYPIDYACAFDTLFEACNRLIPQNPIVKNNLKTCPKCGTIIIYHPNISYCDNCGQAIHQDK